MHLVYFDESGNTGCNLDDTEQPVFLLGALIVSVHSWQNLEKDLIDSLGKHFPELAKNDVEVHGTDIRNGSGPFKGVHQSLRIALRDEWLSIAHKYNLIFICRSIVKKAFQNWSRHFLGSGIKWNPYIAAFPLIATVVNECLIDRKSLGLFISDENDEIARDIDTSLKALRLTEGPLRLSQVIEKGFFIKSSMSRVLQLCDIFALYGRKNAEFVALGKKMKLSDADAASKVTELMFVGNERFPDVQEWLNVQFKQK